MLDLVTFDSFSFYYCVCVGVSLLLLSSLQITVLRVSQLYDCLLPLYMDVFFMAARMDICDV